ncbi:zinc-binding dehydrogenase [Lacticaseibacillus paracasei]|uniref:zinc-binding dehydrogenase n=1 Tax=Lacticaseibacillus paracasei TaxID=1597 RepID=UPI003C12C61E
MEKSSLSLGESPYQQARSENRRLLPFSIYASQRIRTKKISEFVGSDKLRPIIDRIFPFAELPKAFGYSQAGHAKGKIILKLVDNPSSLLQV